MTTSRSFCRTILCVLLLSGSGFPLAAGTDESSALEPDRKEFSYRRLYELLYQFRDLPAETVSQLRFAIRLRNIDSNAPDELDVYIKYGKRRIDVPMDEFGILDLPFSPQLANVNAPVITNQPGDTIEMGLAIIIRQTTIRSGDTELDIDKLLNGMEQVNAALQARSRLSPERTPCAIGITVKFAGDSRGSVVIRGATDEVDYRADEYNTVDIPLNADAPPESIRITDQPLVIFPLFEE